MHKARLAIAALSLLATTGGALAESLTFDILNNSNKRITSIKALDRELIGFTPLDPDERGIFTVEGSPTCEIRVRVRFTGGHILETKAYLCDPGRGLAFKDRLPTAQIVFRDQLGFDF